MYGTKSRRSAVLVPLPARLPGILTRMTGRDVDVEEQPKVSNSRWLLAGLGILALVSAVTLFWTSGLSVDWSMCEDMADSMELLDCSTTRWNVSAIIGSVLLLVTAVALLFMGLRRTRHA